MFETMNVKKRSLFYEIRDKLEITYKKMKENPRNKQIFNDFMRIEQAWIEHNTDKLEEIVDPSLLELKYGIYQIELAQNLHSKIQIGWRVSAHRFTAKDKIDSQSTYAIIHKPGWKGDKWKFISQNGGKNFLISVADNYDNQFEWLLSAQTQNKFQERNHESLRVAVQKDAESCILWKLMPQTKENFFKALDDCENEKYRG